MLGILLIIFMVAALTLQIVGGFERLVIILLWSVIIIIQLEKLHQK